MNTIASFFVLSGVASAVIIALDLVRRPQSMKIMNFVWVLTGLWAGVLALIAYYTIGREPKAMKMNMMPDMKMDMKMPMRPMWQSVMLSTLHCGAGCTLADIIGEWTFYFIAASAGASLLLGSAIADYALALVIGVIFQYAAITQMSKMSRGEAIRKAFKADVLSLTAWQVGMFGFMAFVIFVVMDGETLSRGSWTFWFMMQIAMLCGFIIAMPINALLIKAGVKKAM